jgi:Transcriptional regulatory protein, C terminal
MIREKESRFIVKSIQSARSVSVVGLSNMGKSNLLRELTSRQVHEALLRDRADDFLFAYVDCNLMAERSEQALHEATLRAILSALRRAGAGDALMKDLGELYQQVIQPNTSIRGTLAFDGAIRKVCEESDRSLVVMFDEFDDPFEKLDGRVYLNLRAMKDEHPATLSFVTATERPLLEIRDDRESGEFTELFNTRELWLGFVSLDDAREIASEIADGNPISRQELNFITDQAGGHSGLIKAVTETWMRMAAGTPEDSREEALGLVKSALDSEANVRSECLRIWKLLSAAEQTTLIQFFEGAQCDVEVLDALRTKRLIQRDGGVEDVLIGEVWRGFVKRQALTRPGVKRGVEVDIDSGEVRVDGKAVEPLTELEYKLLLLLYGRLNKIVDKYSIVTNVWGESYLDSVDDARIEKLVSRLRGKLEPGVTEAKYLMTLRGRGYRLVAHT